MIPSIPLFLSFSTSVLACSRVAYNAAETDERITVGRSLDFVADTNTTIFAFPAGLKRNGGIDDNPFTWESKYGSTTALMYNQVYTEGLNTEGLTGSALYLGDSDFGPRDASRPGISVGIWLQYFLDMYATVDEAAASACPSNGQAEKFQVVPKPLIPGVKSNIHLALTDKTGDNLIMEFVAGKLTCWHSANYTVMTNEPTFDQQLIIQAYWEPVSNYSLPGSPRPADRFVRLAHYRDQIPPAKDLATAVSYCAGMVRAVSNPIIPTSFETAGVADEWPTYWRMYTDLLDEILFYESATSPLSIWFSIKNFDLSANGQISALSLVGEPWRELVGDVTNKFGNVSTSTCQSIFTEC